MQGVQEWVQHLKGWVQGERGKKAVIVLGIAGIGLIFLSSVLPKRTSSTSYSGDIPMETVTADQYTARMEERLASVISQVDGAGSCRVMITLQTGTEYQYAREEETQQHIKQKEGETEEEWDTKYKYVFMDAGNGQQALLLTEIQPEIKGVVVVCTGASNPVVQQRIVEVATTAMGVSSAKVCVVPMS